MELLTVFLGAAAGVLVGSAAIEAIKSRTKRNTTLDQIEDATNKARQMLADLAGEMQKTLEPEENKNETQETH